ncbi:BfmA/BtgA family mobilization protein [Christiangramia sp. OXR-203]|uniref:BfmA/BtgA family mobilization protein n=1 Tax=Christiangramia sp. OXR-203 TaxID=3100176 RepID=UPI002AC8EA71|nr:BfmA/BtgA family mobilization protein [Christiangramia sp. OXR-203]WPY97073.1 BfmA/BtgA family mobilization protein [Christiangramia sp. OXR-203]
MEKFTNITIKKKIAQRFIKFSKSYYKTHSEALTGMLDFFYYNEISPKENFGPTGRRLENTFKKRINAVIAIMKDVEKNKANPTLAILESLMEAADPKNKNQIRDYEEDDTHPDFYK